MRAESEWNRPRSNAATGMVNRPQKRCGVRVPVDLIPPSIETASIAYGFGTTQAMRFCPFNNDCAAQNVLESAGVIELVLGPCIFLPSWETPRCCDSSMQSDHQMRKGSIANLDLRHRSASKDVVLCLNANMSFAAYYDSLPHPSEGGQLLSSIAPIALMLCVSVSYDSSPSTETCRLSQIAT